MKIAVLAGGYSPEREVSLTSGSLISNALMENGHRVCLLDVYVGKNELPKNLDDLFQTNQKYQHQIDSTVPNLQALKEKCENGNALIGKNVVEICKHADLAFLALHGAMGENGQMQATLDAFGIPYTGTGYVGSALAMNKDLAKQIFRGYGISTPDWLYFDTKNGKFEKLLAKIGLPAVVKPCDCGSSVGISIVETENQLKAALAEASKYGRFILVEQKITGRELTVGVLDGKTLPVIEIIPNSGWYDYKNKYQGTTKEICPAEIPESVRAEASRLSLLGFQALRLSGYARFDYLLDAENRLWCLEANTLPGMTPTSLLPMAAKEYGLSYNQLCEKIVEISKPSK